MCEFINNALAQNAALEATHRRRAMHLLTPRRHFGTMGGEYLVWPDGRILRVTDQPTTVPEVRRDADPA